MPLLCFVRPSVSAQDAAGDLLVGIFGFDSFIFAADANRDRSVNLDDFTILTVNFGQAGRVFSQGNFDYSADGAVTLDDFTILAAQFGKNLPVPGDLPARVGVAAQRKPSALPGEFPASRASVEGRFATTRLIDELAGGDEWLPK